MMDTKRVWVSFRAYEKDRTAYDDVAELAGVDRSTWIRDVLRRAAAQKLRQQGESER